MSARTSPVKSSMRREHRRLGATTAIAALLVLFTWSHTFVEMWLRWFPAWRLEGLALVERFTQGDSYYTHGPFVPLVSVLICFAIFKRVGLRTARTAAAVKIGWCILIGSLLAHVTSAYAQVTFVSGFSLIGAVVSLVLIAGGWTLLGAYWFPIANLLFMVPVPMVWIADLNFALKSQAAGCAVWVVTHICRTPALLDGSYIHLMPTGDGTPKTLVLENVCGGLRSLISLMWFGALLAAISRLRGRKRAALFLAALPVAVASNIARMIFLCLAAELFGSYAIREDGLTHGLSGLGVYVLAICSLLLIERTMLGFSRSGRSTSRKHRKTGHDQLTKTESHSTDQSETTVKSYGLYLPKGVLATLCMAALLSWTWSSPAATVDANNFAASALPDQLMLGDRLFQGESIELDVGTLALLETSDYACRRYQTSSDGSRLEAVLIVSQGRRKNVHPPEVCLEGSGVQVIHKQLRRIRLVDTNEEIPMRELLTQRGRHLTFHLYTFKAGDRFTPDFLLHQSSMFVGSFFSRDIGSALLRISVPVLDRDIERANALATEAAAVLLSIIKERIP